MDTPKDLVFQPKTPKKPKLVIDYSAPVVHSERQFFMDLMNGATAEEHAAKLVPGTRVNVFWWSKNGVPEKIWYRWVVKESPRKDPHGDWLVTFENSMGAFCVNRCQICS